MVLSALPVSVSRAVLQRHLRRAALATVTALVAVGLAACGGSSNPSASPQQLLSQTFRANFAKIHSGELSLTISADLNGLKSLRGQPASLQLSGPFEVHSAGGTAYDFSATVTLASSTLPVAVVSAGGPIYFEVAGTYYKVPHSIGSSAPSATGTGATGSSNLLAELGIDPLSWLTDPKLAGTKTVGGTDTDRITAQLAVGSLLSQIAKLAAGADGVLGPSLSSELSASNLALLASTVNSAGADVYTGASDHVLRGFNVAIRFSIPLIAQSSLDGVTSGSLALSATITNLNTPEAITAPSSSEPLSDLLGGGGLGSL
jgi:hypothetical protein